MKQPLTSANVLSSSRAAAWPARAAIALILVHASLAIDALRRESVTVDEVAHLPAGISYWQRGTFELYHHNPPLVKLLAALPALATNPHVDYSRSWETNHQRGLPVSQWAFGWEFMYENAARYHEIYFWARLVIVGFSCAAGWVVFLWARELFGPGAGLLGVVLWTFCPNTIAHAGLVTTDMGATSLGFVATYCFWRHLQNPSWIRAGLAGTALGLAQLTKFSLLLLYAIWFLLRLLRLVERCVAARPGEAAAVEKGTMVSASSPARADRHRESGGILSRFKESGAVHLLAMYACSLVIINLGYKFEGTCTPLGEFTFMSETLTRPRRPWESPPPNFASHPWGRLLSMRVNRFFGSSLAKIPVPLPRHYVEGFDEQKMESEGVGGQGYPVYLCGHLRRTGWWWYYFFAMAVKVPLGTWLLTGLAMVVALGVNGGRARILAELTLLLPSLTVLLVMSFLTDIDLGLRYVLPVFPFWFVLLSRSALLLEKRHWWGAIPLLLAVAWNCSSCIKSHPYHLAYFNELVGGRDQGHRYLLDSNLDWGQDLLQLSDWLNRRFPGERVGLAYFGNEDPSVLSASGRGFDFRLAPPSRFDDLVPLDLSHDRQTRDAITKWLEEHGAEVKTWVEQHQREIWYMPAFRALLVATLGVEEGPQPGLFAISANLLHGLPFRLRDHLGNIWNFASGPSGEADPYRYFREVPPLEIIGGSIFVFRLSPGEANRLRRQMGLSPLDSESRGPISESTPNRVASPH